MDTHSLQGLIQRQLTAGGFELPSTVFTGFPLAELLARFFPAGLRLQRASAQTTQAGISLSGYCTLGRSEARAEAAFRVEGGQPHMVLRLSHFPVGWTLADGFPGLEQSMAGQSAFTSVELELDSASPAHLPGELRRVFGFGRPGSTPSASAPAYAFKGRLDLVGRRGLLALLPAELLDMAGPIATVRQVPLASLAAATPLPVTLGPLELALSLGLEASSLELQLQEGPLLHASSHLALRASLAGEDGPPLTFSATSFDWDCSLLSLELEGEVPVGSSLSSLARTLRLPELAEALSPDFPWLDKLQLQGLGLLLHTPQRAVPQIQVALGLEVEWELIPGLLTLRRLQGELYVFEPFQPKQRRFQTRLSGAVDVVGATLQATLDLRTLDYDVRLVQGQQLHLDRLLARCMDLEEDATPPGMVCTLFQLGGNTKAGTFSLYGLVEGDWGLFADMALREVGFAIDSSPQGRTAMVRGVLELGGVALGLEATRERSAASRGWRFEGRTLLEQEVPLGALVSELARKLGLPPIPGTEGLSLRNLEVQVDTAAGSFLLSGDTAQVSDLSLGGRRYQVGTRVRLRSAVEPGSGRRSLTGHLEAELRLGSEQCVLTFGFGQANTLTGSWRGAAGRTLGVEDVLEMLGIEQALAIPEGLELSLVELAFRYDVTGRHFTLSARSRHYGDAFLTAGRSPGGGWGCVFGVNMPPSARLSDLPVIGKELRAADFITFRQAGLLLSTATLQDYVIPQLPALPAPESPGPQGPAAPTRVPVSPVGANTPLKLGPGLSLVAVMDLEQSSSRAELRNLRSLLGVRELTVQLGLATTGLQLYAAIAGDVDIPSESGGALKLRSPALRIDLMGQVLFQLLGGLRFNLDGCDISALARLSIGTTQAQVAVSMEGETGALPSPPGLSGLHLEQFGLAMGVFFAPPGLNLGLQGRLRVGQEQLKDDQFGLVLQMVGAVPNILYLSFYVEEMSLGRVITLFTDEPAPRVVQALELVEARALSFYWAQGQVVLPDGTVAQPGLGLSGQVRVFGLGAYARCRVQADTGLVGEATSSPVDLLGVLKVEGDGKGITRQLQRVEGRWVPVDNRRLVESRPPLPTKEERIVAPGGPVFKLTSQGSPFLHLSWRVSLFELQRQEVEATVSSAGIQFSLEYALAGVQSFILRCTLADWSRLAASVDFGLGVDVRLGPIKVRGINCGHVHLQSVVAASLSLALEASRFDMEVRGQFDFAGATLEFPTLRIQDPFPALEALPGKMVQRLREQAADLFGPWFSDVGKWSELVGRGLVTGFEDLGQVLKGAFNQSHQDAAKLMKKLGKGAAEIAGSLRRTYGLAAEEVAKLLRELGFDLDAVGEALGSAYGYGAELLSRSLKSAGFSAKQVGGFLKSTKRFSDKSVKKALGAAGYSSKTVSKAMGDVFGGSWKRSLGRLF